MRAYKQMKDEKLDRTIREFLSGDESTEAFQKGSIDDLDYALNVARERGMEVAKYVPSAEQEAELNASRDKDAIAEIEKSPVTPRAIPIKPQLLESRDSIAGCLRGADGRLEPKLDGWRLVAHVTHEGTRLWARPGRSGVANELTDRLPEVCAVLARDLPADTVLDGEAVSASDEWGTVQSVMGGGQSPPHERAAISYAVFDVLRLDGKDCWQLPYSLRRPLLEQVHSLVDSGLLKLVPSLEATEENYDLLIEKGFEGGVVKLDVPYRPGARGQGWFRRKPSPTLDVVAMQFDEGEGKRAGMLGAIRFGQYRDGVLVERGGCGTGFDTDVAQDIWDRRDELVGKTFEVTYFGCVGDRMEASPRTASFNHWRPDKDPKDCVWEKLDR